MRFIALLHRRKSRSKRAGLLNPKCRAHMFDLPRRSISRRDASRKQSLPPIRIGAIKRGFVMSSSTMIASDLKDVKSAKATKLRELDTFEEFFWLLEQSAPLFHVVIAEVNGPTTIGQWQEAMDAMQIRYPLLSASIR